MAVLRGDWGAGERVRVTESEVEVLADSLPSKSSTGGSYFRNSSSDSTTTT